MEGESRRNPTKEDGEVLLRSAERFMDTYEASMNKNPYGKYGAYLSVAETNLIAAEKRGMNIAAQRKRLDELRKKYNT